MDVLLLSDCDEEECLLSDGMDDDDTCGPVLQVCAVHTLSICCPELLNSYKLQMPERWALDTVFEQKYSSMH